MKLSYTPTEPLEPFDLDVKRFYVSGAKLEGECPACHKPYIHDFGRNYLSYPRANAANTVHLYCGECDHEWDVELLLTIALTLVEK